MELHTDGQLLQRGRWCLVAALLLVSGAWAQGRVVCGGNGEGFLGYRRGEVWKEPLNTSASLLRPELGAADLGASRFEVGKDVEELAAQLRIEPPPVSREELEGSGEELQRYRGLPGGIVLGLDARAVGGLAQNCAGARLEGTLEQGLALRLVDGTALRLPALEPETLRALLEFSGASGDALVDLHAVDFHAVGAAARLAPAFTNKPLAEELVRLDRLPHRLRPETRAWKTLIVDRALWVEARGNELVLSADLEVRLYGEELGSGWASRASVMDAAGPSFVGPRTSTDLGAELAPLADIAAWLGFLRWAETLDPRGLARLRAR